MKSTDLPSWFPQHPPLYDIDKTYDDNAKDGPFFNAPIPKRVLPPKEKWFDFLGHSVATPLGVPAGPLLTSNWIKLAGELGFDIPIYKTIRSHLHPAHHMPNMVYVDTHGMIDPATKPPSALLVSHPSSSINELAVTNSFGMPSKTPEFLMEDIPRANASLKDGQVMVVSVVGSERSGTSFLDDFVATALFAKNAGAKIIEANFSCPNVDKKAGSLYMSPQAVCDIASAIVKAIAPIPLIIKMGLVPSLEQMREILHAAAKAGVRAVAGINTISMSVVDTQGNPALGPARLTSGICGGPIRQTALEFLRQACTINKQDRLDLTIIGVGGITLPEHFEQFFNAGADVAMTATGMMWDPYLAMRYHLTHETI